MRAAVPAILCTLVLVQLFTLATLPIQLHTYSCAGFVKARSVLDQLAPGDLLAGFDPSRPPGRGRRSVKWSARAEAIYYLDREVVNHGSPAELAAAIVACCPLLFVVGCVTGPDAPLVFFWLLFLWTAWRAAHAESA